VKDENGTPVNPTGSTVTMAIKNAAGATLLTYSTAAGQGITLTNPASGQLTVSPEALGTGTTYRYSNALNTDMKLQLSSGVIYVLFQGSITLTDKVTP
jgi:hypothetical protein